MEENNNLLKAELADKPKKKFCLKTCLGAFLAVILLLIIGGITVYQINKFPPLKNPVVKKYQWQYKEKTYDLEETLYQSTNDYYAKKRKGILTSFEEESISKYFNFPKEDQTILNITEKIDQQAIKNNLSPDQKVDLSIGLVQSLPYDDIRAKTDITHPRYPYETLFESRGICSDKTLLAVAILRQLGYGAAVFMYDNDQHMAAAVQCPKAYSNYDSGYCIAETTNTGHKIGIVPEIDPNLKAVQRSQAKSFEAQNGQNQNKILATPEIFAKTNGKIYQGVIQTLENEKEITTISLYLEQQKIIIEGKEKALDSLKSQMDSYKSQGKINAYNSLVGTYNSQVETIQSMINEYNSKANRYNLLIKE